ncbi:hypothetical protein F4808DRAFT_460265 [Astrocystis sublimbata]|nr:hypothetical protein F4808DRAFT_460265 [Astrocystis sublimbata]
MSWTDVIMHPVVAPDVETSLSKDGNTPKIESAVWVTLALAFFLVAVRTYFHLFRGRRQLWSDDYFLIAALLCLIGNGVAIREWLPYKLEPNVTTTVPPGIILSGSLMGFFNSLALAFSKTSLGITFMRLTSGWWKSSLGLSIFFIDILYVIQGWTYWIQDCDGPPEPFRLQTASEECITFESIKYYRLVVQLLSCSLDAYFTILPWKIVRRLELKRFEKIGLGIAMSFGCASLASGIVRMTILARLANQSYDHQPFYSVGGFLFNYMEPTFSIVAACIPVLRKIIKDAIQWNENIATSKFFNWSPIRRKKQSLQTVLPLSEGPCNQAIEDKGILLDTDTTLFMPSTPSKLAEQSSMLSTTLIVTTPPKPTKPSSLRSSCCSCQCHTESPVSNEKL